MAVTMQKTSPPPGPAAMAQQNHNASLSSIPSTSGHSRESFSSSSPSSLSCITVRKDEPSYKAGIRLQQDSNGQVTVTNIDSNGLFAKTDLAVGDSVLAVNKKRLSQGEGLEALMNIVHKCSTIAITVKKKTQAAPIGAPLERHRKKKQRDRFSILSGSSHHHKLKPRKHPSRFKINSNNNNNNNNNNSFHIDTYDSGMAQHNADSCLRIQLKGDAFGKRKSIKTVTISANKPLASTESNSPIGLELSVDDGQLVVKNISSASIFRTSKLRAGDIILSINDMSFRKFADADYAITIMDKAMLMVTLMVERPMDDCDDAAATTDDDDDDDHDDDDDDDDDDSLWSFGDDDDF